VRILALDASRCGGDAGDLLTTTDPAVAAVVCISPADACSLASRQGLRYAVQCWDIPEAGKAIFWKPSIPLQGLYRAEFARRDGGRDAGRGLLRVTLLWTARPLHMMCAQFSPEAREADWELVQAAREFEAVKGDVAIALDPGGIRLPALHGFRNASDAAGWRSLSYASDVDLGSVVRSAFGIDAVDERDAEARNSQSGTDAATHLQSDVGSATHSQTEVAASMRLLCSSDVRVLAVRSSAAPALDFVLADLAPATTGEEDSSSNPGVNQREDGRRDGGRRTGTYSF
jgi:hypothetical protein